MHILSSLLIFALLGTFIIAEEFSNDLENERVKRVAVDDVDFDSPRQMSRPKSKGKNVFRSKDAASNTRKSGPVIVLPPYHENLPFDKTKKSCLLYLEGITILALNTKTIGAVQQAYTLPLNSTDRTYGWEDSYADCPSNYTSLEHFRFTIDFKMDKVAELKPQNDVLMTVDATQGFTLILDFIFNSGFNLASATISGLKVSIKGQDGFPAKDSFVVEGQSNSTGFRAYYGYNYACSATPAILFPNQDNTTDIRIGVILNNFQVQGVGIDVDGDSKIPYFGSRTADCMPTFNQGTWMGIVVTLVLVSVLAFAFLMLNSVQTMDRFDDPKQKQIVINFKE